MHIIMSIAYPVAYAAVHCSVYFGKPSFIYKLLLLGVYDTMIMQF